jgi:hypothetical protein
LSPTEDEFNRARELGKPILTFVDESARDENQEQFLRRVRGSWDEGHYGSSFSGATDLMGKIVSSLRTLERGATDGDRTRAAEQALALARGEDRRGMVTSGSLLRVAIVPLGGEVLLDALTLDDASLPERLAGLVRDCGLVSQSVGIGSQVHSRGILLTARKERDRSSTDVLVGADGSIVVESDVAAEGMLGSGQIANERVVDRARGASRFALATWTAIDPHGRVRQAYATLGIPDAHNKLYVTQSLSNSMPVPMGNPSEVIAPDPPLLLRREDVGTDDATRRLVVALKRAFADLGALYPP